MTIQDTIKGWLAKINKDYATLDTDIVDFAIECTLTRVRLYLNSTTIPDGIETVLAEVTNTVLNKTVRVKALGTELDSAVSSVSDNGQSISYANEISNYFSSASDSEIFGGYTGILARYRNIKVV